MRGRWPIQGCSRSNRRSGAISTPSIGVALLIEAVPEHGVSSSGGRPAFTFRCPLRVISGSEVRLDGLPRTRTHFAAGWSVRLWVHFETKLDALSLRVYWSPPPT